MTSQYLYQEHLAIIRKAQWEVEVFGAEGAHDSLEVIFAVAGNTDGFALDLRLHFWKLIANQSGDLLRFRLVEAAHEGHFLRRFRIIFD